ncbi:MAG TPA: MBL fold metallo-hydrolase [Parvibaculum sp.]
MSKWMRRSLIGLAVIAVIGGGAYYWLFVQSGTPQQGAFSIDIGEVRRLANAEPGPKPADVRVEHIGSFSFPGIAVVAGDSWKPVDMPVYSYQIVYPDRTAIIDTALDDKLGGDRFGSFDKDAYGRMQKAMAAAKLIVITHEHVDHIGGIVEAPDLKAILPAVRLTKEQFDHPERSVPAAFPKGALDGYQPLVYDKYDAIAPGMVLIKSPGHSPGSQMIYVQKADGSEILFIGDVAWHFRNIDLVRERARAVTQYFLKEDRAAVLAELQELARLHEAEPKIAIVPGHDGEVVAGLEKAGALESGFK